MARQKLRLRGSRGNRKEDCRCALCVQWQIENGRLKQLREQLDRVARYMDVLAGEACYRAADKSDTKTPG